MKQKYFWVWPIALISYSFFSLKSLFIFPFVHSDEIWLAGLSREIFQKGSLMATEPFFDLFPRQPHALKSLFHFLQGVWIHIIGYQLLSIRLFSFFAGLISLFLLCKYFYKSLSKMEFLKTDLKKISLTLLLTGLTAFHIQFLYASHFARQDIFILLFLILTYTLVEMKSFPLSKGFSCTKTSVYAGILTGIAMGFHPNGFLLIPAIAILFFANGMANQKLKPFVSYMILSTSFAILAFIFSFFLNNNFLSNYLAYGESLGVQKPIYEKFISFFIYIYKLYHQIGATYFLPHIKTSLIVFFLLWALSFGLAVFYKPYRIYSSPFLFVTGLMIGLIIIGRYNPTYVVFLFPFSAFFLLSFFRLWPQHASALTIIVAALFIGNFYNTCVTNKYMPLESYEEFALKIDESIEDGSPVLANLNMGFALTNNPFWDYRNLGYLGENRQTIASYLDTRQIKYVILSEEMDYIYRNPRPWSILYGNMDYYPDLLTYLNSQFVLISDFESPLYGMRIVRYADGYPWKIKIFKRK